MLSACGWCSSIKISTQLNTFNIENVTRESRAVAAVYLFVTGNLVAESLVIAAEALCGSTEGYEIKMITDGNLPTIPENISAQCKHMSFDCDHLEFEPQDILITGLMWPGVVERKLISEAKERGALTIVMYPDIAGTVEKFLIDGSALLPDYICVADKITYENLLLGGIPGELIIPIGSLYLDKIFQRYRSSEQISCESYIGYLSVPNANDFTMWGRSLGYNELDIARDLAAVCGHYEVGLRIRKHPKEFGSEKYNVAELQAVVVEDHKRCEIINFIAGCTAIVSSYSTALVIAKKMGKVAISYQPGCSNPARASLYKALGIPVINNPQELESALFLKGEPTGNRHKDHVFFNKDRAQETFIDFIKGVSACVS